MPLPSPPKKTVPPRNGTDFIIAKKPPHFPPCADLVLFCAYFARKAPRQQNPPIEKSAPRIPAGGRFFCSLLVRRGNIYPNEFFDLLFRVSLLRRILVNDLTQVKRHSLACILPFRLCPHRHTLLFPAAQVSRHPPAPTTAKRAGLSSGPGRAWQRARPAYSLILMTTPEPTVRPPSRMARRRPSSMAMGVISSTSISTLSPGMHMSTPSGRVMTPVTSVVRK